MSNIETNICEAIEIIVNKAIEQADYDRTVQATIIKCVDKTIGKFLVKYQDSVFYAYSGNSENNYTNGSTVYILIPGNDMEADKTILGTTKKLGINYVSTIEDDEAYQVIGNNCIFSSKESFNLQSYKENKQVKVLYNKENTVNQNLINLNITAINEYIKNQKTIICGGTIRTELPIEQQFRGNYGIIFALNFTDNTNNSIVTRYYAVDVDKMRGNPYKILYNTRQYGIFDIDGENFIDVDSVSIFCYDFPNTKPDEQCIDDIFIKDIELYGAERLSNDDLSNYSLTFYTPQGIYFDSTSLISDTRSIEAQVRVKGKVIDNNSQKLPFYWFIEHAGITSESTYYNKFGGQGWKCLNEYTVIKKATDTDPEVVEWIPSSYRWIVSKKDIIAKEVKYKCAVVYDGTVITKTIVIKNLASEYDISIISDEGTNFYFDIGYPTLKCLVNGAENNDLTYSWAVTNNVGNFESIANTPTANNEYLVAYNNYYTLLDNIEKELVPLEPNRDRLNLYKAELNKYDRITRVDRNTIWHLNVNTITDFSTYQCTVHQGNLYLGTASIVLTNSLTSEGSYNIIIHDGSCVFKYDERGVSPASQAVDNPIEIKSLTFSVYDNLGNRIDDEVVRHSEIKWIVPINNTMIKIPDSYTEYEEDLEKNIRIYKNFMSFSYGIENRYYAYKNNNDIQVMINYKGISLSAKTDLVFIKEGDDGTNGTEFFCRIVPNTIPGKEAPAHPTITELSDYSWSLNYLTQQSNKFFRVQLWHNEAKILDSVSSANSTEGKQAIIKWSILQKKYDSVRDSSALSVNEDTGVFSYSGYRNDSPAHIVKVEVNYDNVVYYATIPLITVKIYNDNYRVFLKEGTGFTNAVYSSDGKVPMYDNSTPFELTVIQKIDGYDEDVSLKKTSEYAVSYSWNYLGRVYNKKWIDSIQLEDRRPRDGEIFLENQKAVKPSDDYDGWCVTNAIEGVVTKSSVDIARIHIPVHLMLNRYGISEINGWDGNSVDIDENGGSILAPRVGAGKKEADKSFTGVLIGRVRETNKEEDIGLLGYSHGKRSIFLDAYTGKAVFGAAGKGQIVIDPGKPDFPGEARIYSGNFVYKPDGTGTGMEIDLTTPYMRFGSGNFEVSKEGFLTAKGGGSVAGWQITDTELYSPAPYSSRKITLDSGNKKIYSGTKTTSTNTQDGFFLNPSYLVLGGKFKASADGSLEIGTGATAGNSSKRWSINGNANDSYIKYGTKGNAGSVYIGTSDIQLGRGFSVTAAGLLKVGNLNSHYWTIAGRMGSEYPAFISYNHTVSIGTDGELTSAPTIDSTHPTSSIYIGTDGIAIGSRFLITANNGGKIEIMSNAGEGLDDTTNGFYLSSDGLRIGNKFKVTNGEMLVGSLSGAHWTINGDSSKAYIAYGGNTWNEANSDNSSNTKIYLGTDGISLGERFSVSRQGALKAYSGTIGGWKISKTKLTAGSMEINSNGSIKGGSSHDWSISSSGTATFDKIKADVSGTIGNCTISSSGISTDSWSIKSDGSVYFSKGTIGGWNIGSSSLSGGNVTLNKDGSLSGSSWSITAGGQANFSNINVTGGKMTIGSGGTSFGVSADGKLTARSADISGKITATSGEFGGWTINSDNVRSKTGNTTLYSNGRVSIESGNGYFRMGGGTTHPEVSGLNLGSYGIKTSKGGSGQSVSSIKVITSIDELSVDVHKGSVAGIETPLVTGVSVGLSYKYRNFTFEQGIFTSITDATGGSV